MNLNGNGTPQAGVRNLHAGLLHRLAIEYLRAPGQRARPRHQARAAPRRREELAALAPKLREGREELKAQEEARRSKFYKELRSSHVQLLPF